MSGPPGLPTSEPGTRTPLSPPALPTNRSRQAAGRVIDGRFETRTRVSGLAPQTCGVGVPASWVSGFEDILASYGSEFRLVVEVTAKRQVNEEDFKAQVDKAIAHAVKRNEKEPFGETTHALVIAGASIEKSRAYREIYNAAWPKAVEDGNIRLIPIWGPDWAQLVADLGEADRPVGLGFDSAALAAALDRIYDRLTKDDSDVAFGWTRTTLLEVLEAQPELPTPPLKPPRRGTPKL